MLQLSIIITAHDEGILAHKTLLSVQKALETVSDAYEIIIHIDKGTPETLRYFKRYRKNPIYHIYQNQFGDLGLSRNFAVGKAQGKYVLFLDADDLISENYISAMWRMLRRRKSEVIVSPQYCLCFEDCLGKFSLQELPKSTTREEMAKLLFGINPWISSVAGQRKIFLEHPYPATVGGFGHEDYALNIELTRANIPRVIAPNAVYFYRRRPDSMLASGNAALKTQPYNELFDYRVWQKYTEPEPLPPEPVVEVPVDNRSILHKTYDLWRRDCKWFNGIIEPISKSIKSLWHKDLPSPPAEPPVEEPLKIPDCVLKAWKAQSAIEMQLYPTPNFQKGLVVYDPLVNSYRYLSHYYWKLCRQITHSPDYVFIVPWIVSGGSDKVLLNYVKALQQIHPKWKISIITTMPVESPWRSYLSEDIDVIDFGNTAGELASDLQHFLFTRLLVQLNCKKLHIINAFLGYEWVQKHLNLARDNFEVYISLFCDDLLLESERDGWWGYADPYLIRMRSAFKKAFTDNQAYIDKMVEADALDAKRLCVIHQPVELITRKAQRPKYNPAQPLRILWASRIALQKNPDLMVRIAQKLDPAQFKIEAFGRFDLGCEDFEFPADLPTLEYKGEFDGLSSIDLNQYDILLYTSYTDGLPNVLLEAAAAGLPILASHVGGVGDFIKPGQTGFLVDEIEDENKYIDILKQIRQNPELIHKVSKAASSLLVRQHSWEKFCKTVEREF